MCYCNDKVTLLFSENYHFELIENSYSNQPFWQKHNSSRSTSDNNWPVILTLVALKKAGDEKTAPPEQ